MIYRASRLLTCLSAALILVTGMVGCEQKSAQPSPGGVAVVNMSQIAQASGFDQKINQNILQAQQQEQGRLMALQQQLGLDKQPEGEISDEENARLFAAQQQMQQAVEEAQRNIQMRQLQELEQFRTIVRPIAERVAAARGFSVVLEQREGMLSIDPTANITDEVIAEMPQSTANTAQPQSPSNPMGQGVMPSPGMPGGFPVRPSPAGPPSPGQPVPPPANQLPSSQP